jgi:hypothetical protein
MTGAGGCVGVGVAFLVLMAPVYWLFRTLVKLTRIAGGFAPAPSDDGPPLRICPSCHNTVLEPEFERCPYCAGGLSPVDDVTR